MRRALAGLAVLLLVTATAHAEGASVIDLLGSSGAGRTVLTPTGAAAAPPMSRPIDPAEYIVGPGDFLQINLSGGVTRSWDAMILPEGTLYVPSVGAIAVTGMTLAETRRAVLQRISQEYRGVEIDLRLLRPRSFLVYVAGETTKPGALEVSASSRASEVLVDGLFTGNAARRSVEVRRRAPQGETRILLDLTRQRLTGTIAQDPLLREGDVLFLPRAAGEVWIDGAVGRAGRYELAPGDSLSTLFALAGGPLANATDRAVLVRFRDATQLDSMAFRAADVMARKFDLPLRDGDHVFVYYLPRFHFLEQASIYGEVEQPGAYPLLPGFTRLSQLVGSAGGFLPTADLAALRVFRSSPTGAEVDPEIERLSQLGRNDMTASEYEVLRARATARRQEFRIDWLRVKPMGDLDITLRAGDIVRVDPVVASIRVEGEVRLPGLVRFEPGRRVSDYVRLAGGFSERASRGRVRVRRAVSGQTLLAKDVAALQPGDLVWVPERGEGTVWENLRSTLLVLAQVATFIVAVRR